MYVWQPRYVHDTRIFTSSKISLYFKLDHTNNYCVLHLPTVYQFISNMFGTVAGTVKILYYPTARACAL